MLNHMTNSTLANRSLVVLISGRGSNLQAILTAPVGRHVVAVISDNEDAAGLEIAAAAGVDCYALVPSDFVDQAEFEEKLLELLCAIDAKIIALAGFMRILGASITRACAGKMVNIHPSLLPQFPGLNTHARALAAGCKEHGCTVHWVSEKVDGGEIIAQSRVPILSADTLHSLAARVLSAEHKLYPATLAKLLEM